MIDVNRAWDLDTATEAVGLLEPLNPRWLKEPVRWAGKNDGQHGFR